MYDKLVYVLEIVIIVLINKKRVTYFNFSNQCINFPFPSLPFFTPFYACAYSERILPAYFFEGTQKICAYSESALIMRGGSSRDQNKWKRCRICWKLVQYESFRYRKSG